MDQVSGGSFYSRSSSFEESEGHFHTQTIKVTEAKQIFLNKVKEICRSINPGEVTGIHYKSFSKPDSQFKIFILTGEGFLDPAFDVMEKRAARIHQIYGYKEADFASNESIPEADFGMNEYDFYDLELKSQNISRAPLVETLRTIREELAPTLSSSKSSELSE